MGILFWWAGIAAGAAVIFWFFARFRRALTQDESAEELARSCFASGETDPKVRSSETHVGGLPDRRGGDREVKLLAPSLYHRLYHVEGMNPLPCDPRIQVPNPARDAIGD